MNHREPEIDRRSMLRTCLRYTLAGGIAAGSLGLMARSQRSSEGTECRGDLPCRDCGRLAGCALPQAVRVKQRKSS